MKTINVSARFVAFVGLVGGLFALFVASCGGKPNVKDTGPTSPMLTQYPALRYVPAEFDVLVTASSLADGQKALTELAEMAGLLNNGQSGQSINNAVSNELVKLIGIDLLSSQLATKGIDPGGAMALYVVGPSITVVIQAPDGPAAKAAMADRMGGANKVGTVGGVDISLVKGEFVDLQLATVDGWLWAHVDFMTPSTLGDWLTASRNAAGAGSQNPTLTWAVESTGTAKGPASVIALLDAEHLSQGVGRMLLAQATSSCSELGRIKRVAMGVRSNNGSTDGALAIDITDGAELAQFVEPEPIGWSPAGPNAQLVGSINANLPALGNRFAACLDSSMRQDLKQLVLVRGRLFVEGFDVNGFRGDAGVVAELTDSRMVADLLDQIPMRSVFESRKKFGAMDGYTLSIPMVGDFSYAQSGNTWFAGKGKGGDLARLVGTPGTDTSTMFHVEAQPSQISADTWDLAVSQLVAPQRRADTIRRIRQWTQLQLAITLAGNQLVLRGHAVRQTP